MCWISFSVENAHSIAKASTRGKQEAQDEASERLHERSLKPRKGQHRRPAVTSWKRLVASPLKAEG